MRTTRLLAVLCIVFLLVFAYSCNKGTKDTETIEAGTHEHGEAGDHSHEGETEPHTHEGEGVEEGKESGPQIGLDGTHDEVQRGIHLILSFDSESSAFVGTVENVSEKTVSKVRVEVHLSNGTDLGPTEAFDLAPGKKIEVKLPAAGQTFNWWKAHAEADSSEH